MTAHPGEGVELLPVAPLADLRRRRSAKWRMHPADVLPLPVAEMDFAVADPIRRVLTEAVAAGDLGYAYPDRSLYEAFAGFAGRRWGWTVDPSSVTAVSDVSTGLLELARVDISERDQVILSPPCYPPFFGWQRAAGGRSREVPLRRRTDGTYALDLDALETAFRGGPGVYLLANPQNPTGSVPSVGELTSLAELAARYGIRVYSDEIHAPILAPGVTYTPFLSVPGGADVGVALLSASKAWNLAGLRCAVIVAPGAAARQMVAGFPPELAWTVGHLGAIASEAAFSDGEQWLDRMLATLLDRRRRLADLMTERLPSLDLVPFQSTYLAWIDANRVGAGDEPYRRFYDRGRVALEPGLALGAAGSGFVRMNFATSVEILDEATARMAEALA